MRLNKFIAQCTGLARRKADLEVENGNVKVNGEMGEMGMQIDPARDEVFLNGEKLQLPAQSKTVVAMNKPAGVLTSREGWSQKEKTVYDLLPRAWQKLRYVGRLDRDTCGLLLFTDDGELLEELTHPRHEHEKEYLITAVFPVDIDQVARLSEGVMLEDGIARISDFRIHDQKNVSVVIAEGRKRVVRRLCVAVGIRIDRLERVRFGGLELEDLSLREGESRGLTADERARLLKK